MDFLFKKAVKIIKELEDHRHEAVIVGGYVRDKLSDLEPKDIDIATSASMEEISSIFDGAKRVTFKGEGKDFSVCIVDGIEVASYRTDTYKDSKLESVKPASSLKEDVQRRDLTINALAMTRKGHVIDYVNGRKDIEDKKINFVGDGGSRIQEDPTRIYRAVRFYAMNGYSWGSAIQDIAWDVSCIPPVKPDRLHTKVPLEQIKTEIQKAYESKNVIFDKYILELYKLGLLEFALPNLDKAFNFKPKCKNPYHKESLGKHLLDSVKQAKENNYSFEVAIACLLHDIGKPYTYSEKDGVGHYYSHEIASIDLAREDLLRLTFPKTQVDKICVLIKNHMRDIPKTPKMMRRLIIKLGDNVSFEEWARVWEIDKTSRVSELEVCKGNPKELIDRGRVLLDLVKDDPINLSMLEINGNDVVKEIDIKPGPMVGKILKLLFELVVEKPDLNNRLYLLRMIHAVHRRILEGKDDS